MKAVPTPRILKAIREKEWSTWGALFELVDNSFGEHRGHASHVSIYWNPRRRFLIIHDNGRGMDDIRDLFVIGQGTAPAEGDIGFYGVGGSEAGLWLGTLEIVETLRDTQVARLEVHWDDCIARVQYPDIPDPSARIWRKATARNCDPALWESGHGTMVALKIRKGVTISPEKLRTHLSRTFAAGLRHGRQIDWIEVEELTNLEVTTPLQPWNPGEFKDAIDGTVTIGPGLSAHVRAGRVENLSVGNSKLAVNYLYRQIKETTDGFGRAVQGACGYIDLSPGWLEHLTTNKDNFREESRHLETQLMTAVAELLRPLVDQLERAKLEKLFDNLKIKLETKLQSGIAEISRRLRKRKPTPPGPPKPPPGPEPEPGPPRPPRPPVEETALAIVRVQAATDAALDGLLCRPVLNPNGIVALVNEEHELIKEALKTEPINQRLLETILVSHLASQLVAESALVKYGVCSQESLDALMEKWDHNVFDVVLELTRILTDGLVRETPEEPELNFDEPAA